MGDEDVAGLHLGAGRIGDHHHAALDDAGRGPDAAQDNGRGITAVSGRLGFRVTAEQLEGPPREAAWQRIASEQPRYAGYQQKTDRVLPVIRLSPVETEPK